MTQEQINFLDYLITARNEFVLVAEKFDTKGRVASEDILIAFDQLRQRYINQLPDAGKVISTHIVDANKMETVKHYCPFDTYAGTAEDVRVHILNKHRKENQ